MTQDTEMLNYIHQNAQMGRDGIMHVLKFADDTNFRNVLESQLEEFESVLQSSEELLKEKNEEPESVNPAAKITSYVSSTVQTALDNSPSHIADMTIQGSTMGITKLTKHLNNYDGSDRKIVNLAEKELKIEKNNIDELKKFL